MKLNDKLYEVLKWIGLVCLPAVAWFVVEVGADIGIANAEVVAKVLNALGTLLGILIGVSTYNYRKCDSDAD
jgi:hypothetical protein